MAHPSAAQMWQWTLGLPEQLAYRAGGLDELAVPDAPPRRILVAGMGGSGVSGRFLAALANSTSVQIVPWKWAGAPCWLTPNDAVLATSYSGNTAETLATVNDALAVGVSVVGITTGGRLAKLLQERERPVLNVPDG
ncbi:SIS domain-containing protein, partial [bacterium]|nr:SIS domain-containing protein [bacterium]